MFGIEALDVVIGMIFIYLLFSLFVTIVNELLTSYLNVRGRELAKVISSIIDPEGTDSTSLKDFYKSDQIKLLIEKANPILIAFNWLRFPFGGSKLKDVNKYRLPDSITAEKYAKACIEKGLGGSKLAPDLVNEFEGAMFMATARYKRKLSKILFGLGFLTAIVFNINSIDVFKTLNNNPEARAKVVEQATKYYEANLAIEDSNLILRTSKIDSLRGEIDSLRTQQISQLSDNLSLGWDFDEAKIDTAKYAFVERYNQIKKLSDRQDFWGWLITAIAISLGAPFWFDLLKKVVNIKNELKPNKK